MSRSVKSLHQCPATNWGSSIILQIGIVVLIITQLVNSQNYYHPNDNGISGDRKKTSTFKFQSPEFEVSFDISHDEVNEKRNFFTPKPISTPNFDKELVKKAMRIGIFHPPDSIADKYNPLTDNNFFGRVALAPRSGADSELLKPMLIPEECRNKLICETDGNYPEEAIRKMVDDNDMTNFRVLAVADEVPIAQRISDDGTENLCRTIGSTVPLQFPRGGRKSLEDPWLRMVNVDNFEQPIETIECAEDGGKCSESHLGGPLVAGYELVCKQQYSYRQVIVISPENATFVMEPIAYPSNCCCRGKRSPLNYMSKYKRDSQHNELPEFVHNRPYKQKAKLNKINIG